ncbi:MAG TPA: hypothetical protein VHO69_17145 [Phototrophicaceae bacterium]|nr:hypothetical protein [Phototrophicaceae bacterium]
MAISEILILLLVFGGVFALQLLMFAWRDKSDAADARKQQAVEDHRDEVIAREQALLVLENWGPLSYHLFIPGQREPQWPNWKKGVLLVTPTRFVLYPTTFDHEIFSFAYDQLRWIGLAHKEHTRFYEDQVWFHVEKAGHWSVLKTSSLGNENLLKLRKLLNSMGIAERVGLHRRRGRRDLHYGPVRVVPATQDIHGAWTLAEPVSLFLIRPRFLLILDGQRVLRELALEQIQQVAAVRRLDAPKADGLVSFRAEEERFNFALKDYEAFAQILAEAVHSRLEEALEQKQKKSDDWDDGDFDESDPGTLAR